MGSARIFLQAYDTDLNMGATYPLVKSSAMETTFGASIAGNNLIYAFRTRGTVSFVADDTESFTSANNSYKGLVAMQTLFRQPSTPTGDSTSALENSRPKTQKVIINGQLYIRRGDRLFNALGQML